MCLFEFSVERDADQSAITRRGRDGVVDRDRWLRLERATADDADAAVALGNEDTAIGRARERRRCRELIGDDVDAQLGAIGCGNELCRDG